MKIKKIISSIIAAAMILTMIPAMSVTANATPTPITFGILSPEHQAIAGIGSGTGQRGAVVGDWIYYTTLDSSIATICRVNIDGTGRMVLFSREGFILVGQYVSPPPIQATIYSDWIYFTQFDGFGGFNQPVFRVRIDVAEQEHQQLFMMYASLIYNEETDTFTTFTFEIINDWIYYDKIRHEGDNSIIERFRIRLDGTGEELVTDSPTEVAMPTATPSNRTFTNSVNVTLATTTDGAAIYFTTDGTAPATSSSLYSAPIPLSATTTIKAIAVKDGVSSEVMTVTFTRSSNTGGSTGGGGGGGGGGSSTPPTTPPTTTTPTVTTGTSTWTVTNIPRTALTALNLNSAIPVNQVRVATGQTGNVSVAVGAAHAGQNAILVQYNAETRQLEFVSAARVGTNGNASINVTQAGDFLVLTFKTGDVTGTGEVDTGDALAVLRHAVGLTKLSGIQTFVANGKSGEIDTSDALNILRYAVGLIDKI